MNAPTITVDTCNADTCNANANTSDKIDEIPLGEIIPNAFQPR